jgi:aldose 1-epimerase
MAFSIQINEEQGLVAVLLSDGNGTSAEIYSMGGLLNRFSIPLRGNSCNLVAGFNNLTESREKIGLAFQGARLSPFVCRMRNGTYTWLGVTYHIEKKYLGAHAIHGLMYDTVFNVVETKTDEQSAAVVLEGKYDGSDPGYPFPYQVRLEWVLRKESNLTVTSTVWHENEEMIPLAEGWHPYFTLGGKTDEWELQFNTNRQMEYDADLLPTGRLIADDRFVAGCLLKGIHLDNGFVWTDDEQQSYKCVVKSKEIELTILPDKSFPVLQVFTPDDRKSIALENLSGAPDNFNNQLLLISLPPGEQREFTTTYRARVLL